MEKLFISESIGGLFDAHTTKVNVCWLIDMVQFIVGEAIYAIS
jgi:hypothetical protein